MELNRSGVEWYFECLLDYYRTLSILAKVICWNQNDSFLSEDPCGFDVEVLAISGRKGTWQST